MLFCVLFNYYSGIAPNMMLAKVCSDRNKPNGQFTISHDRQAVMDFIKDLPIRKVPGIGKVTEKMLKALGIETCTDLHQQRALLSLLFSETSWQNFLHIAMGLGSTHLEKEGERKSMSTERTFSEMNAAEEQFDLCRQLCMDLAQDLGKEGLKAKTVTLKLKNVNFEVKTRASTVTSAVSTEEEIFSVAKEILKAEMDAMTPESLRLRLMGVRVSGFLSEDVKKQHQKSITSFLCSNKPPSSTSAEGPLKLCLEPTSGPRESFFNQKRAARQIKKLNACTPSNVFNNKAENVNENVKIMSSEEKKQVDVFENLGQKEDLTCPICSMKQSDWDLDALNEHIDKCLSRTPISSVIETLDKGGSDLPLAERNRGGHDDDDDDFQSVKVCKMNLQNKIVDVRPFDDLDGSILNKTRTFRELVKQDEVDHNHCTTRETKAKSSYEMPSKNILCGSEIEFHQSGEESKISQPGSSTSLDVTVYTCPICNSRQDGTDLAAFNRHVDVCLNKGFLEEISVEAVGERKDQIVPIQSSDQEYRTRIQRQRNPSQTVPRRPLTDFLNSTFLLLLSVFLYVFVSTGTFV
uniref:DNA polymerase kappa n=1 Tax=Leptobrachium leishanense TaxID=445787 RepID=A0A8C5QF49_9ANUR